MRILLDEGLPQRLRHSFAGHEVATVRWIGWGSFKNGKLLDLAEETFDVLLTGDQNLPYQQNLRKRKIAVVVLATRDLQLETLELVVPSILDALRAVQPGTVVWIDGQPE